MRCINCSQQMNASGYRQPGSSITKYICICSQHKHRLVHYDNDRQVAIKVEERTGYGKPWVIIKGG